MDRRVHLLRDWRGEVVVVDEAVLIVDVHKGALHARQRFYLVLQEDAAIVRLAKRRALVHHQLELNKEARAICRRTNHTQAAGVGDLHAAQALLRGAYSDKPERCPARQMGRVSRRSRAPAPGTRALPRAQR